MSKTYRISRRRLITSGLGTAILAAWPSRLRPDRTPIRGNTVCLFLSAGALRELRALFEKLSEGAELTDLTEQFFGTYGALNDKLGVRWMFQPDKKD